MEIVSRLGSGWREENADGQGRKPAQRPCPYFISPACAKRTLSINRRNVQHPTSNIQHPVSAAGSAIGCWMFDVGCWMFPSRPPTLFLGAGYCFTILTFPVVAS
ncbi:MAG TPA: hypothetical protein VMU04_21010 [Candidatus Acidoferrum sp.]|nr:hypothetical protein [Candidatus Acidoferrum sp.]